MSERLNSFLWQQNPIFAAAGLEACDELAAKYPATLYEPDAEIVTAGDPSDTVYIVLSGTVRIFHRSSDGREVVVKFLRAPNSFGDLAALHSLPFLECLAAVDEALVAGVPTTAFISFLKEHPAAMFEELKHMSAAFCVASRNECQILAPIAERVANLVLSYADLYGQAPETADENAAEGDTGVHKAVAAGAVLNERYHGPVTLQRRLSKSRIARSLGVVQRSVARVLSDWRSAGFIGRESENLVIEQPNELEKLAAPIRGSFCYYIGMPLDRLTDTPQEVAAFVEVLSGHGRMVGRRFPVGDQMLVGRQAPAKLLLPDDMVSPLHCRIFLGSTGGRYWIEDLESLNGTWIADKTVSRAVLRPGMEIKIGRTLVRFLTE